MQIQQSPIEEAVRARYAMVIPILKGMLYSTKRDMIQALGGYERVTLEQFARVYVESPGDYGICFEYAVHQSLQNRDEGIFPLVTEVINDFCGIKGNAESILFGAEKTGQTHILTSVKDSLTDDSRLLVRTRTQPPKLKRYIDKLVKAFRSEKHRADLPQSIRGCPLPYSGEFMQLFGASFAIVKQIVAAKGRLPSRVALYYEDDQAVAKWMTDRNTFPVLDILNALDPLKQPSLILEDVVDTAPGSETLTEATAPIPLQV